MSRYAEDAQRLGDEVVRVLSEHERRQHGGERCQRETINLLAYLGHRAGLHVVGKVPETDVRNLLERIRDYDAIHQEHTP